MVDASTNPIEVGIPEKGMACLAQVEEQALEGLFLATESILRDSKKYQGQFRILLRRPRLDPRATTSCCLRQDAKMVPCPC